MGLQHRDCAAVMGLLTLKAHAGVMKWGCLLACVLMLAACGWPSPGFRGVIPTRVNVEGSTFDVRVRGSHAEAQRVNAQYAPRFGIIRDRAARAMAEVSGCEVAKISGDQALAFGRLRCDGRPYPEPPEPLMIECEPVRGSGIKEIGQIRIDLDCAPV